MPVALTQNVASAPSATFWFWGWFVITGGLGVVTTHWSWPPIGTLRPSNEAVPANDASPETFRGGIASYVNWIG